MQRSHNAHYSPLMGHVLARKLLALVVRCKCLDKRVHLNVEDLAHLRPAQPVERGAVYVHQAAPLLLFRPSRCSGSCRGPPCSSSRSSVAPGPRWLMS